jgi:hypothetical protein
MARVDEDGVVHDDDQGPPNGHRSLEEIAAATVGELALRGEHTQLSWDVDGGRIREDAPLSSSVAAKLPKLWVDGQYQIGDRVRVTVEFEVEAIGFVPVRDKGMRIGTERVHRAEYVGHERA